MCDFGLGAIDSPTDLRDYRLSDLVTCADDVDIPKNFRLEDYVPNSTRQTANSCVAHSISKIKRYYKQRDFSVGFIYGYRKESDHQGEGLILRQACANICEIGDCYKETFPYDIEYPKIKNKLNEVSPNKLINEALNEKALSYIRLDKSEIKEFMYKYNTPVMIKCKVYKNFYESKTNGGYIPKFGSGEYKGNHAMVVFEWKDNKLSLDNHWGNTGDNGVYYIDVDSPLITEAWAIIDIKIEKPKSYWEKYDTPSGTKWKYIKDGKYVTNDWLNIGNDWFRFDSYGVALQNQWYKDNNGYWYYFNENCYMVIGWQLINGDYYYFNNNHDGYYGRMLCNEWSPDGYWLTESGKWNWKEKHVK